MLYKIICASLLILSPLGFPHLWSQPGYFEPWGKDADLKVEALQKQQQATHLSPMGFVAEKLILFHQNVLSPVDGPRSHFRPSSSSYMLQAIQTHGFVQGFIMGCDRLLRENNAPWVYRTIQQDGKEYKWDPPPQKISSRKI